MNDPHVGSPELATALKNILNEQTHAALFARVREFLDAFDRAAESGSLGVADPYAFLRAPDGEQDAATAMKLIVSRVRHSFICAALASPPGA